MEIGDAFIVNKADREGANIFAGNLTKMLHQRTKETPVFKTIADKRNGIDGLLKWIENASLDNTDKRQYLYTEKAFKLIQNDRMKDVLKTELQKAVAEALDKDDFNLYRFVSLYN